MSYRHTMHLPDIGEGVLEGEVIRWLVAPGDAIVEDQPLLEIMTDKATVVIPSSQNGTVEKLYHAEGEMANINGPIMDILVRYETDGDESLTSPTNVEGNQASAANGSGDLTFCSGRTSSGRVFRSREKSAREKGEGHPLDSSHGKIPRTQARCNTGNGPRRTNSQTGLRNPFALQSRIRKCASLGREYRGSPSPRAASKNRRKNVDGQAVGPSLQLR